MSKTAFVFIPTLGCLDPVLAEFSFVLAIGIARHHLNVLHAVGIGLEAHLLLLMAMRVVAEAHRLLLAWRERLNKSAAGLESRSTWDERWGRCLDARHELGDSRFEWVSLGAEGALQGGKGDLLAIGWARGGT